MRPVRVVAGTALPLWVTTVVGTAGSVVNTVLLGRRDTTALAAFVVAMAVYVPVVATVTGVMRGVMPFAGRHADEPERLGEMLGGAVWLSYTAGLLGAAVVASTSWAGGLLGVDASVTAALGVLPLILAVGVLSQAFGSAASSALVALGQGKAVLRAGLTGTGAAVVLSFALVPPLGVAGAGCAVLASTVAYSVQVQVALRRHTGLTHTARPGPFDRKLLLTLTSTGLPMAGTVLVKFVVLGVLTIAAARLGSVQAAAHGFAETLVNLIYSAAIAVGQAVVPLVSRASADSAAARRAADAGAIVALGAVGGLAVVLVVAGRWVVPLFTDDLTVRPSLLALLPLVALAVVGDALQAVYGFALLGLRRTLPSLISTIVFFGLLCLAAVPIADLGGLTALWAALACANFLQAAAKASLFRRRTRALAR